MTEGSDTIVKLECNLDDCTGEAIGYAMERLFEAGARDVFYTPIYMKKNRPACLLSVLCVPEDTKKMEQILFRETSTIGIRRSCMERTILGRSVRSVSTSCGTVEVKMLDLGSEVRAVPEYESVAAIARRTGMPFPVLFRKIEAELASGDLISEADAPQ